MYEKHFGLKEKPFTMSPDPRFIYLTTQHREVLAKCQYSISEKMGLATVFGPMGCGKTSLARRLWEQYAALPHFTFGILIHPNLYPTTFQFLQAVLKEYKVYRPRRSLSDMVADFENFLIQQHQGRKVTILVIDEGEKLTPPILELIRQFLNFETNTEKLLQIVIFGDNNLLLRLDNAPALKDRVNIFGALSSLSREDADDLIMFRYQLAGARDFPFTEDALAAIFKYSQGLPRRICNLCNHALLRTFSQNQRMVDLATVEAVAEELRMAEASPLLRQKPGRKPKERSSAKLAEAS